MEDPYIFFHLLSLVQKLVRIIHSVCITLCCQNKLIIFINLPTPITIFTWMQDNSYLRTPKNKISAKKTYFAVNCTHLIHKTCIFCLPLPISVTVSIFTVSALILLTLTPYTSILFIAIPCHIIITLICCIEHVLKPFMVTSGEMLWCAVMMHID